MRANATAPAAGRGIEAGATDRLPLADRVLYGLGSLGNAALFWFMGTWIQYFYSPPRAAGPSSCRSGRSRSRSASVASSKPSTTR